MKDIDCRNLSFQQVGTRPDGRPTFGRRFTTFSDVVLLTNTERGLAVVRRPSSWERPFTS